MVWIARLPRWSRSDWSPLYEVKDTLDSSFPPCVFVVIAARNVRALVISSTCLEGWLRPFGQGEAVNPLASTLLAVKRFQSPAHENLPRGFRICGGPRTHRAGADGLGGTKPLLTNGGVT